MDEERTFEVVIPYREPTFEVRRGLGRRPEPFVASYTVRAADAATARQLGLERFEQDARASGVGWIRDPLVEAIRVRVL